ncbi:polyprenyl diphosphate synthase [Streptomyces sp. NPDC059467]|uniref:polyprenyl diphosphate synthase n=1 Tax=Streptomyces sp. NPDC059467 TaxID=3346844 RepID=UPI003687709D
MIPSVYARAGIHDARLREAYRVCWRLTRQRYPHLWDCMRVMPAEVRLGLSALAATFMTIDDLTDDGPESAEERVRRASAWITALEGDVERGDSTDPVRKAMVHLAHTLDFPVDVLRPLSERMTRDVERTTPRTWQEWAQYQRRIHGPCLAAMDLVATRLGAPLTISAGHAEAMVDMMLGLQLVDDLTDLAEDLENDYVKLPLEALDACGLATRDLLERRWTPAVAQLVRSATERARAWLHPDEPAISWTFTSAVLMGAFRSIALVQLGQVEEAGAAILAKPLTLPYPVRQRILLSTRAKAAVAWKLSPFTRGALSAPAPREHRAAADLLGRQPAAPTPVLPPPPHPSGARPPALGPEALPRHVAIVMDGNGRWAADRALPRAQGHRAGAEALRDVVHGALEIGLPHLTVYTFSTENWNRSPAEVEAILDVVRDNIADQKLFDLDLRFRWSGVPGGLPKDLVEGLQERERTTRHRTNLTFTVCINYGGRSELAQAAQSIAQAAVDGRINPVRINQHTLAGHLPIPDLPDVDLLWRTGGEQRTSNFLPWHSTYAELHFTPTYWPDTDRRDLWHAIATYTQRQRRYGTAPTDTATLRKELHAT